jgi:hypothetical protein
MAIINFNSISGVSTISVASSITVGNNVSIGTDSITAGSFVGDLSGNVTGTVNSSGIATFTNGIVVSAGTTAAPSISPSGDSNTGIFFPSPDTIAFSEGGIEGFRLDSSGNFGVGPGIGTTTISDNIFAYNPNGWSTIGVKPASSTASAVNIYRPFGEVSTNNPEFFIGKKFTNSADGKLHFWRYNGTSHLSSDIEIDSSGRVTIPYQPGFFASSNVSSPSNQPGTGSSDDLGSRFNITSQTGGFNTGNHYNTSTGVFTAPVSGKYYTFFNMRWETLSFVQNNYIRIFISINGSTNNFYIHQICGTNEAWNSYLPMSCSGVVSLSAGDTLRPRGGLDGGTASGFWMESSWGAWLLG